MKIIAAIMDVVHVKPHRTSMFGNVYEQFVITRIKKYLVYDPRKVTCRDIDDARAKQIR